MRVGEAGYLVAERILQQVLALTDLPRCALSKLGSVQHWCGGRAISRGSHRERRPRNAPVVTYSVLGRSRTASIRAAWMIVTVAPSR